MNIIKSVAAPIVTIRMTTQAHKNGSDEENTLNRTRDDHLPSSFLTKVSYRNLGRWLAWPLIMLLTARRRPLPSILYSYHSSSTHTRPPRQAIASYVRRILDRSIVRYHATSTRLLQRISADHHLGGCHSLTLHSTVRLSNIESNYSRTHLTGPSKLSTRVTYIHLCHMAHERSRRCCSL